jgi:methionine-rich copper-binding protein CopC
MRTAASRVGAVAGAVVVLVLAFGSAPAHAHNSVIDEGPAADSTIAEPPGEVWIETNDVLLDIEGATAMDVVGPDGRHYATACPTVDGAIASVAAELGPAGEYTVAYRVVSADGHPITGDHTFVWAPADGDAVAEGSADAVCTTGSGDAASGPDDAVGGVDEGTGAAESGAGADVAWIVIAAVVVIGAGIAAFAFTRRRPGPEAGPGAAADTDADAASDLEGSDDR